jgi:phosphoglycolate phosphatase
MVPLVFGFDLDMTLVDSRPGIHATVLALVEETGHVIDPDVVVSRLGPPLEEEMAEWVPADQVEPLSDRFREIYGERGIEGTFALPGAAEALSAVRAIGGQILVVTAKYEPNAWKCLAQTGLDADVVVGWRHGLEKGRTLAEHGASAYIGDTPPDIAAAHLAGATALAVPTGPFTAEELRSAGADVVLESLLEFPGWLRASVDVVVEQPD